MNDLNKPQAVPIQFVNPSDPSDPLGIDVSLVNVAECGSKMEPDRPRGLVNAKAPAWVLGKERFEHRIIIYLKAEGFSNKEIAEKVGFSSLAVSNLLRQPWAQEAVLRIIQENGGDAVQTLLNGAALDAVQRLITEMDNESTATSRDRVTAADKLLDRLYGKPNQPIEHRQSNLTEMSDEELEALARKGSGSRPVAPGPT